PRFDEIGVDFAATGEYRTLAASYAEIRDVARVMKAGPVEVRTVSAAKADEEAADAEVVEGEEAAVETPAAGAPARRAEAGPVQMRSLDEFVEHFIALGRKGVAV